MQDIKERAEVLAQYWLKVGELGSEEGAAKLFEKKPVNGYWRLCDSWDFVDITAGDEFRFKPLKVVITGLPLTVEIADGHVSIAGQAFVGHDLEALIEGGQISVSKPVLDFWWRYGPAIKALAQCTSTK